MRERERGLVVMKRERERERERESSVRKIGRESGKYRGKEIFNNE